MMPLSTLLLLAWLQSPSAPGRPILLVPAGTVSSAESAFVTWTAPASTASYRYDVRIDGGTWRAVTPIALDGWSTPGVQASAADLGLLPLGPRVVSVRECAADGSCVVSAPSVVSVVLPTACVMGPWSQFTDWTGWQRSGAIETRSHVRYRGATTMPGIGAAPCPAFNETAVESRAYVPPVLDPVTVAYVRMDSTTKGAWRGVYGGQGMAFPDSPALPFVAVTPVGAASYAWSASTTDVRGLQKPGSGNATDRTAATWYSATAFTLDVRFADTAVHEVALYAVDWDDKARGQTIEILDTQDRVLASVTTGGELAGGVYYVWRISGHARFRVTHTAGPNAVVFALLFGESK